jgi:hypothetical protein
VEAEILRRGAVKPFQMAVGGATFASGTIFQERKSGD